MAFAQILLLTRGLAEVPAEALRAAVEAAARREGLSPGSWTYDASAGTVVSDGTEERITDGVWAGFSSAPSTPLAAGTRRQVITSFRQNVSGPITEGTDGGTLARVSAAVRAALGAASIPVLRSGFRTIRNRLAWDRDIPRAIELGGGGGGGAALGLGVVALGAIVFYMGRDYGKGDKRRRGGGLRGWGAKGHRYGYDTPPKGGYVYESERQAVAAARWAQRADREELERMAKFYPHVEDDSESARRSNAARYELSNRGSRGKYTAEAGYWRTRRR